MDKSRRGSSAFEKWKNEIPQSCTDPSWTDAQSAEAQLFSCGGKKAPNTTMLPSLGNRRARMITYEKNDLALQLFPPLKTTVEI